MKLYKKIMKAFGGSALYLDKTILNHLGAIHGDEVVLELVEDKVIITKSRLDNARIQRLLDKSNRQT
jgi:antitoxin component of MazEF toxin-antitoxin module